MLHAEPRGVKTQSHNPSQGSEDFAEPQSGVSWESIMMIANLSKERLRAPASERQRVEEGNAH